MQHTLSLVLFIFALVASTFAELARPSEFVAPFEMRSPFMTHGVVAGNLTYSWSRNSLKLHYQAQNFKEVYLFNSQRGYSVPPNTTGHFENQWVSKVGRSFECEINPIDFAMPMLFKDPSLPYPFEFSNTGHTLTLNGKACDEYVKTSLNPSNVAKIYFAPPSTSNDSPFLCRALFDDGREFTFGTPVPLNEIAPFSTSSDCKCNEFKDIALVLDRSGSITQTLFQFEMSFARAFSKALSVSPSAFNVGLVHFNTPAWTTLEVNLGVTQHNVESSVGNLGCCTSSKDPEASCCCCGSSISSGVRLGADELKKGRIGSEKLMVILVASIHDTDIDGNACTGSDCHDDLVAAVQYAHSLIPGLKIIAVGVGNSPEISEDDLLTLTNENANQIIHVDQMSNLPDRASQVLAPTCEAVADKCGTCCGLCLNGQCTAPDSCESSDYCEVAFLPTGGTCCDSAPRDCAQYDLCNTYSCDPIAQECVTTPIECKPSNSSCYIHSCEPSTGQCVSQVDATSCSQISPECNIDSECNDINACTIDTCSLGICKWETLRCNDHDACTTDTCDTKLGCLNEPFAPSQCDDRNLCTLDTCDPQLGCTHNNVTCKSGDSCTESTCDPFKGCFSLPMSCDGNIKSSCHIGLCLNGSCTNRRVTGGGDHCSIIIVDGFGYYSVGPILGIVLAIVLGVGIFICVLVWCIKSIKCQCCPLKGWGCDSTHNEDMETKINPVKVEVLIEPSPSTPTQPLNPIYIYMGPGGYGADLSPY